MFDDEHGSLGLHVGSEGSEQSWTSFWPHCAMHDEIAVLLEPWCMQHKRPDVQSALDVHASDAVPFGQLA
jgi:hypothetical protein